MRSWPSECRIFAAGKTHWSDSHFQTALQSHTYVWNKHCVIGIHNSAEEEHVQVYKYGYYLDSLTTVFGKSCAHVYKAHVPSNCCKTLKLYAHLWRKPRKVEATR